MFGGIGSAELIVLLIVAVILFGRKLPEVARTVGGSYAQFRKGLTEIQNSIESEVDESDDSSPYEQTYDDTVEPTGPKFDPPTDDED